MKIGFFVLASLVFLAGLASVCLAVINATWAIAAEQC
jgi:hypothetical protein